MNRINLITKEKSKEAAEGKLKNDPDWEYYEGSINDDLDSFVHKLQKSEEIDNEEVSSFFTSKLTKEELKLVEHKNEEHMRSYQKELTMGIGDVDVEEMKKSDSKDKYVLSDCQRRTVFLTLRSEQASSDVFSSFEDYSDEVSSDVLSDVQSQTDGDAGLVAGRIGDVMGHRLHGRSNDPSNHLRSPIRKIIRK